ncbi:MAG: hypothetical protein COV45_00845 [Deltaproteobacteria bacterium CG11_big_fil_rev_8_21_14_0_20_47_16]|nr:MAG: hypothetical protein COV45_00845 [Deltaproteobacteria bacterium CG11_big_fil_rev_8_21_14_0_20_47_16]
MHSISILAYDIATSFNLKMLQVAAAEWGTVVSKDPVIVLFADEQYVAIFDYGSVVFFNCDVTSAQEWIERLTPFASRMSRQQYSDSFTIHVGKMEGESSTEELYVPEFSLDVVKLVAVVLSRSVSLEYFESLVDRSLGQLEDAVEQLAQTGKLVGSRKTLIQQAGLALNIRHELAYNLGLLDDPDIVWEGGARMYELYARLSQTFDVRERVQILQRKMDIITKSSEFIIQRIQDRTLTWQEYAIIVLFILDLIVIYWVGAK